MLTLSLDHHGLLPRPRCSYLEEISLHSAQEEDRRCPLKRMRVGKENGLASPRNSEIRWVSGCEEPVEPTAEGDCGFVGDRKLHGDDGWESCDQECRGKAAPRVVTIFPGESRRLAGIEHQEL